MKAKKIAVPVLAILLEVLFPCVFIYFNNAGETDFVEVLPAFAIIAGAFLFVSVILLLVFKDYPKAVAVVAFFVLFFMNFSMVEKAADKLFPNLYYWHVLYLIVIITVIWAIVVNKFIKSEYALLGEGVMALVCGVLIVLNGVMAIPTISQKLNSTVGNNISFDVEVKVQDDMPNVYLLVFDEYGGYECLQEYCGYDNSPFYDAMKELGFNVSYSSYGTSISTHTEVPNLFNLDHITTDDMLVEEKEKELIDPLIYQIFRQGGYKINVAASSFIDMDNCDYLYKGESTKEYSAEYYIVMKTAFYPFYKHTSSDEVKNLESHLDYIKNSSSIMEEGLFTVSYYSCPHLPWFADENGDSIDASLRENWLERNTYLGQLKFLNTLILPMMQSIIENNPDAVILLFSDHGFRVIEEMKTKYGISDTGEDPSYQRNILNMVYYRGDTIEIEGLSNINTLRMVLNKLLGTNYEMLEQ